MSLYVNFKGRLESPGQLWADPTHIALCHLKEAAHRDGQQLQVRCLCIFFYIPCNYFTTELKES